MRRVKPLLCFAMLFLLIGCARTGTIPPDEPHEVNSQQITMELEYEESVVLVINEAFLSSSLSQYAVEDTLFLLQYYATENDIEAQDIESHILSDTLGWGIYFTVIPKYEGATVQVEQIGFDENLSLEVSETLIESISTVSYALLITNAFQSYTSFPRIIVTYNGISATYDMRFNAIGYLEQPYAFDGYVSNRTSITPEIECEIARIEPTTSGSTQENSHNRVIPALPEEVAEKYLKKQESSFYALMQFNAEPDSPPILDFVMIQDVTTEMWEDISEKNMHLRAFYLSSGVYHEELIVEYYICSILDEDGTFSPSDPPSWTTLLATKNGRVYPLLAPAPNRFVWSITGGQLFGEESYTIWIKTSGADGFRFYQYTYDFEIDAFIEILTYKVSVNAWPMSTFNARMDYSLEEIHSGDIILRN